MFDQRWDAYHDKRSEWDTYPNEDLTFFIYRTFGKIEDRRKIRILDLGCGIGPNTWFLAREGFRVVALDASETALALCRDRMRRERVYVEDYVQSDCVKLPFPDAAFHAVIDVVCTYANPLADVIAAVQEARRVLVPGGKLFSVMPGEAKSYEHFTGRGDFTVLTPDNYPKIFTGFPQVALSVAERRGPNDTEPYLSHVEVIASA